MRQQSIQKAAMATDLGTTAAGTSRSSAACRACTAIWASAACRSHVQDAARAATGQAGTSSSTVMTRGFATRTLQPRRTGTGGWQDNPNHQALYLVSSRNVDSTRPLHAKVPAQRCRRKIQHGPATHPFG